MSLAIITGASSGLGWQFACELDKDPEIEKIWLIARRKDKLDELKKQLKTHVELFHLDLTSPFAIRTLGERINKESPVIKYLINNAGFGLFGNFEELSLSRQLSMIDLNIKALTELSYLVLPFCTAGSRIIQVASTAGFMPMVHTAVYAATKAYVLHFSIALNEELKKKKIGVYALCPGPVQTEFFDSSLKDDSVRKRILKLSNQPEKVVKTALKQAGKNKGWSTDRWYLQWMMRFSAMLPKSYSVKLGKYFK